MYTINLIVRNQEIGKKSDMNRQNILLSQVKTDLLNKLLESYPKNIYIAF